jgi:hypothetical protein
MTNWKRVTFVVFVLVGGITAFGYWSFNQFNNTLSSLETTLTANMLLGFSSLEKKTELTSISPEAEVSTIDSISTNLELSFDFPKKGDGVYISCTYPISWQSSTAINLLETVLVDAGTSESVGPIASGLAKENIIEKDLQNLNWKVGAIWPGAYYIKVLKINDTDTEIKSNVFTIDKIPQGANNDERKKICKESGGLF